MVKRFYTHSSIKKTAITLLKLFVLAFLLHLAIFYFRLAWFVPLIWLAGLFFAFFITKDYLVEHRKIAAIPVILFGYAFSIVIVWNVFFDQKSHETFQMTWGEKGSSNQYSQSEVVLRFSNYPDHSVGIFSDDLRNYLNSYSKKEGQVEVQVTFEVTSDFWCMRGFHEERIGELEHWKSADGSFASRAEGATMGPYPWPERWWCI